MSQCNLGEPWRVQMNADIARAAASRPNLQIVYKDAQNDSLTQRAQVEELFAQGIELLIISPKESAPLTKPVAEVYAKHIPVIVLDRAVEGDQFTTFIGADNRAIGKAAGEFIAETLGGKGNVVEIKGLPGSTPARDRSEGFREAIASFPGIKIVHDPVANWLREEAMSQMEAALSANEKIDLVYAHNDPMAVGAWLAARAKGRESAIRFVGIDGLPGLDGGRQAVTDGKLAATFVYPTGGKEAVDIAVRILKGESVPHRITLPTERITRPATP